MSNPSHALVNWLEIPVTDMQRAMRFYESVFEHPLRRETIGEVDLAVFTHAESAGALVQGEQYRSSAFYGPVPYFNAPQLDDVLARVTYAGGRTVRGPVQQSWSFAVALEIALTIEGFGFGTSGARHKKHTMSRW